MSGQRGRWYRIENAAGARATVRIYDAIGGWFGLTASDFARELDEVTAAEIDLRVNSPGGDVWEAMAIMNALRAHPARVTAYVDGLAASAASYVVAGGAEEVVMGLGTELMIHNPTAMTWGDADLHRDSADRLDSISDNLATIYQRKAGGELSDWREAMAAETWYSAEEAVAAGLADRVDGAAEDAEPEARFSLSIYNYAGRSKAPAPKIPAASADGSTRTSKERSPVVAFSDEQLTTMRQRLGVADDADEATILAALDEALSEQSEPRTPEGIVTIEASVLADLQAQARAGQEARDQQQAEHRERVVNAAVGDGRIAPARREHWLAQLAADPGAEQVLASLAPGLVPLAEKGYTGGVESSGEDALYASLFGGEG